MKKLLAAGCCILAFQNVSQVAQVDAGAEYNGKRVLIKALAVIINSENNRKAPPKHVHIPNVESPQF
ncbi:MAG TPA: hypothetical protein VMR70_17510 [Flavisolibacter sp.]|nr:hypothetical protein [Flavisolibacter sp.]